MTEYLIIKSYKLTRIHFNFKKLEDQRTKKYCSLELILTSMMKTDERISNEIFDVFNSEGKQNCGLLSTGP